MKSFIFILITGQLSLAATNQFHWNKLVVNVPQQWHSHQIPVPPLSGYYLVNAIGDDSVQLFVHTQNPNEYATQQGSDRYWKQFNWDIKKAVPKCRETRRPLGFKCYAVTKDKFGYSMRMMYWIGNKERLLVRAGKLKSRKQARQIASEIKVSVK